MAHQREPTTSVATDVSQRFTLAADRTIATLQHTTRRAIAAFLRTHDGTKFAT